MVLTYMPPSGRRQGQSLPVFCFLASGLNLALTGALDLPGLVR